MDKRERALDWLVGLLPVMLMAFIGYRWKVVALFTLAVGGYLAATLLLEYLCHRSRDGALLPHALWMGVLIALALPGAAPLWVAALGGGGMALAEAVPARVGRMDLPYFHPFGLTYLLLLLVFPGVVASGYTLPIQWVGMDGLSSATPLAALSGGEFLHTHWQLFFGVRAGAIGEICVAAVLLGAAYLFIRRRLRWIAPVSMLLTVALLSLIVWNAPLYGVLAGAPVLAAVLLADNGRMPRSVADQITAGVTAGAVTVLLRAVGGWADGTAVGILAAYIAVYVRPYVWRWMRRIPGIHPVRDIFIKKKNNG